SRRIVRENHALPARTSPHSARRYPRDSRPRPAYNHRRRKGRESLPARLGLKSQVVGLRKNKIVRSVARARGTKVEKLFLRPATQDLRPYFCGAWFCGTVGGADGATGVAGCDFVCDGLTPESTDVGPVR